MSNKKNQIMLYDLIFILQGPIQILDLQKRGTRAGHLSHLPTVCQRVLWRHHHLHQHYQHYQCPLSSQMEPDQVNKTLIYLMLCLYYTSVCFCVSMCKWKCISVLSPETTAPLSSTQGSLTPLSPPGLSVTIPDQLLHTCKLQPVIFKGQMDNYIVGS